MFPLPWESEFAHGRSEASPDSEQIEHTIAMQYVRNSVSVEQIQDRVRVRANATLIVRSVMVEMFFYFKLFATIAKWTIIVGEQITKTAIVWAVKEIAQQVRNDRYISEFSRL